MIGWPSWWLVTSSARQRASLSRERRLGQPSLVDRLPDGGFRIVDYKTGRERQALVEPTKGDLQLAIYAMALAHLFPDDEGGVPRGVAEYWVLSAGRRGTIALDRLDLDRTRAEIGDAIDAMLAGRFERSRDCRGPCGLFAHD